ncbi:MAG: hypothetical protein HFF84_08495 [Oscillibacter sp.]|nr:hypothetical protein [Oscillibacter sp.]
MLARNETIFKWLLYAVATAFCLLLQGAILQRLTFWGVIPFLYPLLAVIPASYEGPIRGTIFSVCVGIACDLLLPGPIPCLYTLTFPLAGLCAALLSQSFLTAGILCSFAGSMFSFLLTDSFRCLLLWMTGNAAWRAGASVMLREFCVTAPLIIPVTLLFRSVYRRTHWDD